MWLIVITILLKGSISVRKQSFDKQVTVIVFNFSPHFSLKKKYLGGFSSYFHISEKGISRLGSVMIICIFSNIYLLMTATGTLVVA